MSLTVELLTKGSRTVQDAAVRGEDPSGDEFTEVMRDYYIYLTATDLSELNPDNLYAFQVYQEEVKREIIESLLISDAELEEVEKVFEVTPQAMAAYKELFFNVDNLVSKLDLVEYIETYPDGIGKGLKLRAYNLGPEFIFYKYANIVPRTEIQKTLVKKMFMGSAYKAMEANYTTSSAASAKAAISHATLMLKAYETMQKLMSEDDSAATALTEVLTIVDDNKASTKKIPKGEIV